MPTVQDFMISMRLAFKAKIPLVLVWLLVILVLIVWMAAQFSARHPATVALDVGFSVMRLLLPFLVVLLVQELMSREFENKLYLTTLTYARSRSHWLFGRLLAVLFISLGFMFIMSLLLSALTTYIGSDYNQATPVALGIPYFITLGFMAVDLLVVIAIAFLLAVTATTPSFVVIGTIGFVIVARSYAAIIQLLQHNPYSVAEFADPHLYQESLGLIVFLLPDLGRMDVRMIALYDQMAFLPTEWPLLITATLLYAATLFMLSIWVFNKREFN